MEQEKNNKEKIYEKLSFGEKEGYAKQGWEFYTKRANWNEAVLCVEIALANNHIKNAIKETAEAIFKEVDEMCKNEGSSKLPNFNSTSYNDLKLAFLPNLKVGVSSEVS